MDVLDSEYLRLVRVLVALYPTVALDARDYLDLRFLIAFAAWALPLLGPLRVAVVGAALDLRYWRE